MGRHLGAKTFGFVRLRHCYLDQELIAIMLADMDKIQKLERWLYKRQASWRRFKRLLFPSPAELQLVELMGGKVWRSPLLKNRNGFPLAIIISMGKVLRKERIKREVRCGPFYIDFGNDIMRGLEIDGAKYHTDIVYEYDRDVYLTSKGWRVHHIRASDLWREPDRVQRDVLRFMYY